MASQSENVEEFIMNNWEFGVTMLVVGMGGTLLSLWVFSLLMSGLKKVFPYRKNQEDKTT
jgi:hypothetical protein